MLSENGDVIMTGRKMYMRRVHLNMRTEGIKALSKRIRCCSAGR